jgi:hypothetical protein
MNRRILSLLVAFGICHGPADADARSAVPEGHCSARVPVGYDGAGGFHGVAQDVRCAGWIGYAGVDPMHAGTLELAGDTSVVGCVAQPSQGRVRLTSARLVTIGIDPDIVMRATWTASGMTLAGAGASEGRAIALSGGIRAVPHDLRDCGRGPIQPPWVEIDLLMRDDGRVTATEPEAGPPASSEPAGRTPPPVRKRKTCRGRATRLRTKRCACLNERARRRATRARRCRASGTRR